MMKNTPVCSNVPGRLKARYTMHPINCIPSRLGSVVPAVDDVAPLAGISAPPDGEILGVARARRSVRRHGVDLRLADGEAQVAAGRDVPRHRPPENPARRREVGLEVDRKSTRLNSSHLGISYAVFCLKKKKKKTRNK